MPQPPMNPEGFYRRLPLQPHALTERVTPTADVIVLCHLGVPRIPAKDWSLVVEGLVDNPIEMSHAEFAQLPRATIETVHQCAGSPLAPEMPTRRICHVSWSGVRLADILARCAPRAEARYVWSYGADHGAFEGVAVESYLKDLPIDRVGEDVLLADTLNGAPLPPEHGFPVRLVAPGFYGTNSVKWLTRIVLADTRAPGPFTTRWYNDPVRDMAGSPTGATRPVWAIAPEAVIVAPAPDAIVTAGEPVEIWGWAWGDGGIAQVDITVDGQAWEPALLEPRRGRSWQRFSWHWTPASAGAWTLRCRARSIAGHVQPESGARNAIHTVPVTVRQAM